MKKQSGFTLLEVIIASALGVFILSGVINVFIGMRTTATQTTDQGNMQETGRFVLTLLTEDLMRQGFWGDLTMGPSLVKLQVNPSNINLTTDCDGGGINNSTFPKNELTFRSLWGTTAASTAPLNCIVDAVEGSDIIQLKRVNTVETTTPAANNIYLVANTSKAQIVVGTNAASPEIENSKTWQYQHNIYYVSLKNGRTFPSLSRVSLAPAANLAMESNEVIEGVERLRFLYGIDTNGDDIVDVYLPSVTTSLDDVITQDMWDQVDEFKILSVKVYVLVRAINADVKYTNTNVYQLGDVTFTAPGDNFRRMVFSTTVSLHNGNIKQW